MLSEVMVRETGDSAVVGQEGRGEVQAGQDASLGPAEVEDSV